MKRKVLAIITAVVISVSIFITGTKINTKNHINLNTVINYEVTNDGLMLYTNDGNGYYIEE